MNQDFISPINTQTWSNGRHPVRCVRVIQETWDVRTFCFTAESPLLFFFKPGQFVTLELEIDGQQVMRSYTIASSPSVPYSFSITVKRVPGGVVSNWLHDNLKEGDALAVHGPVGNFNCIDFPNDKVLLLSGGVGITPVMSMARWWFDTNAEVDIHFVHSARTPKDLVFYRELQHMDSRLNNIHLSLICERTDIGETWSGYRGYLSGTMLSLIAPDFMDREIFCCGPAPYMKAVRTLLQHAGFDMDHYHEESFGATPADVIEDVEHMAQEASELAEELERTEDRLTVSFLESDLQVDILPGETLHSAAAQVGLHIPKACGMGICGTCKVKVTKGEVAMEHNGGITDEDVAEGYVLSCCSVPSGNVEVAF